MLEDGSPDPDFPLPFVYYWYMGGIILSCNAGSDLRAIEEFGSKGHGYEFMCSSCISKIPTKQA